MYWSDEWTGEVIALVVFIVCVLGCGIFIGRLGCDKEE